MKRGVTIMKAMPLHRGHELLIDFGAAMLDSMYVIVSGKETDVIPVSQRYDWVCDYIDSNPTLVEKIGVMLHIDESPTPVNVDDNGTVLDAEFQEYWKKEFSELVPDATHFVSSDMYGKTMAELLGIKWLPVDPDREMANISATQIRSNPSDYFNYISDVAKPYFVEKVAIVGPESSGKSTMVKDLKDYFDAGIVNEYGRTLSEVKNNDLTKQDFLDIMNGQQAFIDIATRKANSPWVIIDTEAYTTYLFSKIYLGEHVPEILEFGHRQQIDHYIVLSPDVEWVNDGTRVISSYKERKKFFDSLIDILIDSGKSYSVIYDDDYSMRYGKSVRIVEELAR